MIVIQYSFIIKKAKPEDSEAIVKILREAFAKYKKDAGISVNPAALTETVRDVKRDIENIDVFIAYIDNVPVGTIRVRLMADKTAQITRFAVKSQYSKNGVGKALISTAEKFLLNKRVRRVYLYTASKYSSLVCFYYSRGFHIDSTTKDKGYTRALMIKDYDN